MIQWPGKACGHKSASSCSQNHCHFIEKAIESLFLFPSRKKYSHLSLQMGVAGLRPGVLGKPYAAWAVLEGA